LSTLAPLVGLAAASVGHQRKTLNLLPIAMQNELAFRRRQPVVIAAAVMIVGALIAPLHHFNSATNAANVQALQLEAQARPLREIQSRQAELFERIAHARTAISLLQEALDKKTTWVRFFADLQDRLGEIEDVWLESVSVVREATAGRDRVRSPLPGTPADFRLVLTGRLLDERNPVSKVSLESYDRIKRLIESLSLSEFVSAVEGEQFDNSQPGILRFGFTLVVRPERSL
jgi:type IV pilus assembly protein PilM